MADARKFLINTDYSMDKIVYMHYGSQTIANNTYSGTITIPHGLGFTPLAKMQWSNTSDFAVTNEHADNQYFTNIFASKVGQDYDVSSNATNIVINLYNTSGASQTVYYRIYCFPPSDISVDTVIAGTSSNADKFVISTDYNYMKLFHDGLLTTSDTTYTHNLGYIPRVLLWQKNGSTIDDFTYGIETSSGYSYGVYITTTQLILINLYVDKLYYRIYADE